MLDTADLVEVDEVVGVRLATAIGLERGELAVMFILVLEPRVCIPPPSGTSYVAHKEWRWP